MLQPIQDQSKFVITGLWLEHAMLTNYQQHNAREREEREKREREYSDNNGLVFVVKRLISRSRVDNRQPLMSKITISMAVQSAPIRTSMLQPTIHSSAPKRFSISHPSRRNQTKFRWGKKARNGNAYLRESSMMRERLAWELSMQPNTARIPHMVAVAVAVARRIAAEASGTVKENGRVWTLWLRNQRNRVLL